MAAKPGTLPLSHSAQAFVSVKAASTEGCRTSGEAHGRDRRAQGCASGEPGPLLPTLLLTRCTLPCRPHGWMKGQKGLQVCDQFLHLFSHLPPQDRTNRILALDILNISRSSLGGGSGKKFPGVGNNVVRLF